MGGVKKTSGRRVRGDARWLRGLGNSEGEAGGSSGRGDNGRLGLLLLRDDNDLLDLVGRTVRMLLDLVVLRLRRFVGLTSGRDGRGGPARVGALVVLARALVSVLLTGHRGGLDDRRNGVG